MKKRYVQLILLLQVIIVLLFFGSPFLQRPLMAQPVLSAENIALGGGGTAYLEGFEATFYNPANLAIPHRRSTIHIGLGNIGALYEPVLSRNAPIPQAQNFADHFLPFTSGDAGITTEQRNSILTNNYRQQSLASQHRNRADLILGGLLIQGQNNAFSLVARARVGSRIETGRGWYDSNFISSGGERIRDFTLSQQTNQLYELSMGFAREFTFINGLFPRFNKLYVGVAPKIVATGPRFNADLQAQYIQNQGDLAYYNTAFSYRSTGGYSAMTDEFRSTGDPGPSISRNLNRYDIQPTGLGLGLDFGLTYFIPLDNELPSLTRESNTAVSKSLRFAFSINDLGLVQERRSPLGLTLPEQTIRGPQQPVRSTMFTGAGGQYLSYLNFAGAPSHPLLEAGNEDRADYYTLLPTSFNGGFLLDLIRMKLMGDLAVGLRNTAFSTTAFSASVGMELRPIDNIPLRAGAQLTSNMPVHIGLGTGYEGRYLDFTFGSQIFFRSGSLTPDIVGGGFAGIQLHL